MPSGTDYLPRTIALRLAWLNAFNTKLAAYMTTFQLPAGAATALANDLAMLSYVFAIQLLLTQNLKDVNAYLTRISDNPDNGVNDPLPVIAALPTAPSTLIHDGIFQRVRALVRRIKGHPNYTNAIGADLGIVGPSITVEFVTPPVAVAKTDGDFTIQIDWKKGKASGVIIQSRRGGETAWTQIGSDTASPFIDSRPPLVADTPETREYRLRYHVNDKPVGPYTDAIIIIASA